LIFATLLLLLLLLMLRLWGRARVALLLFV
jgi:hypothetical protein